MLPLASLSKPPDLLDRDREWARLAEAVRTGGDATFVFLHGAGLGSWI